MAVEPTHPVGTVYDRLGSLSQVTEPELLVFLMNLYWNEVPTGSVTVAYHNGLDDVYLSADNATALAAFQLPS